MTLDARGRDELNDIDETIRQILVRMGDLRPSEVDIDFSIPDREWSGGVTRPTINCYLFNIHERKLLREEGWQVEGDRRAGVSRRPPPLYVELTYLLTAWTQRGNFADEHRLLWRVLRTLARFPVLHEPPGRPDLPDDGRRDRQGDELRAELRACLPESLRDHPLPIYAAVAQPEGVLKSPGEFWSTFENPIKPSLSYAVTVGLDRERAFAGPPVLAAGIRIQVPESTAELGFRVNRIVKLPEGVAPGGLTITVPGTGYSTTTDSQGRFWLGDLPPGQHLVSVEAGGGTIRRTITLRDPRAASSRHGYGDVVRDQSGAPIAGVVVTVAGTNLRAATDHEGRFHFDLPPGRHIVALQHEGWAERREVFVRETGYGLTFHYGGVPPAEGAGDTDG
ncbi:MAG: DUF4255 domain-containing protein [Chloroflexales bacterium]|nr:DUF4255 domain-containing protein [Chloroflexales bacterium]